MFILPLPMRIQNRGHRKYAHLTWVRDCMPQHHQLKTFALLLPIVCRPIITTATASVSPDNNTTNCHHYTTKTHHAHDQRYFAPRPVRTTISLYIFRYSLFAFAIQRHFYPLIIGGLTEEFHFTVQTFHETNKERKNASLIDAIFFHLLDTLHALK